MEKKKRGIWWDKRWEKKIKNNDIQIYSVYIYKFTVVTLQIYTSFVWLMWVILGLKCVN